MAWSIVNASTLVCLIGISWYAQRGHSLMVRRLHSQFVSSNFSSIHTIWHGPVYMWRAIHLLELVINHNSPIHEHDLWNVDDIGVHGRIVAMSYGRPFALGWAIGCESHQYSCYRLSVIDCGSRKLNWSSQLVHVTMWNYIVLWLSNENVRFDQAKSFRFYNIRTTYRTFVSRNWTPEKDVMALCNSP